MLGDQGIRTSLSCVQTVYGDGTFNRCCLQSRHGHRHDPDPEKSICKFAQCYVIIGEWERTVHPAAARSGEGGETTHRVCIPIIHALLPGQDEGTYKRLFEIVKNVYPQLRPTRFKSDYEKGVVNAVQRIYPGIKCEGDSFHLFQAVMKRVKKHNLDGLYKDDIEIYDQVRIRLSRSCNSLVIFPLGPFADYSFLCSLDMDGTVLA